jgi:hypothetical protein
VFLVTEFPYNQGSIILVFCKNIFLDTDSPKKSSDCIFQLVLLGLFKVRKFKYSCNQVLNKCIIKSETKYTLQKKNNDYLCLHSFAAVERNVVWNAVRSVLLGAAAVAASPYPLPPH